MDKLLFLNTPFAWITFGAEFLFMFMYDIDRNRDEQILEKLETRRANVGETRRTLDE